MYLSGKSNFFRQQVSLWLFFESYDLTDPILLNSVDSKNISAGVELKSDYLNFT